MEFVSVLCQAMQAVVNAVNYNSATQLAAVWVAGHVCVAAAMHAKARLTCCICTCTASLEGKTAVVTGANTGIGYYTALDFAKRKARVIVAGRNEEKIETAARNIRQKTGNSHVVARLLDVSLMKSVRAFVKEFLETEDRLDILVNNAGIVDTGTKDLIRTEEGFELMMATNHLGHFLLTNLLLDKMKKSAPSRIINISSSIHASRNTLKADNLNAQKYFDRWSSYIDSKLCNVLFTRELAHQLRGTDVTAYSVHPGEVATEIFRRMPWPQSWMTKIKSIIYFKSSEEGAQTTKHCAVAPGIQKYSGEYFEDCKLGKMSDQAKDDSLAKAVWDASASLVSL